jgi:hypothetical protein
MTETDPSSRCRASGFAETSPDKSPRQAHTNFSSADPPPLKLWRGKLWQRKNCAKGVRHIFIFRFPIIDFGKTFMLKTRT